MNDTTKELIAPKKSLAERRAALIAVANEIDEIAAGAMIHFKAAGSMAAELQLAQAMVDLRSRLTQDVMAPIMSLMDTDLGFRTDRDPKVENYKTGKPNVPYTWEQVRDVVIEAKLRGFHTVGNEFNIIAGRFYAAKNGFRRKLTSGLAAPGFSNFRDSYEVPRMAGEKGAIVKCSASWTINGKTETFSGEFAIKVNAAMGADAIVGKAERKLCKRVHDLVSGISTPDGEAGDEINITQENPAKRLFGVDTTVAPTLESPPIVSETDPYTLLEMVIESKGTIADFVRGMVADGVLTTTPPESIKAVSDIPLDVVRQYVGKDGKCTGAIQTMDYALANGGEK